MECRLCLYSAAAQSSVSTYDNLDLLVQRIWNCCQLQVKQNDGLPDTICQSCESNLKVFTSFKNICVHNDKILRLRLSERLNIKTEEVILDDLNWENEFNAHSSAFIYNYPIIDVEAADKEIRNTEKSHKCKTCLKSLSSYSELKTHMYTHSVEKPHKCELCLKSFALKSILVRHLKIPTGDRPYKCDFC
ncbi:uncharacterized protein LOC143921326 [Arctopsyche grandis]|uniref:uncharacterized protein LOC143921326 n=1 Tax=Arctopsyche grandis TaxID=121162 RepID=UPI00406D7A6F